MVAVASAVIGAPLTTILIVFELTRNYDLATAAMVSVVFSNLVAYRVFGRSLFDVQLRMRGFDLSAGRDRVILERRSIEGYVSGDFTSLAPDLPLAEATSRLLAARRHEGHVVDAGGIYLGSVKLAELLAREAEPPGRGRWGGRARGRDPRGPARRARRAAPHPADLRLGGDGANGRLRRRESIPVLEDEGGGRMLGVVSEAAIVRAYRDTMEEIRREENAGA